MLELFSEYTWSKNQKTLPYERHGISGIGELTHIHSMSTTVSPPLHYHCDFIEIYCMLSGSRHTTVHENGHIQSYSVAGNEAFLVYPFELHSNGDRPQPPCEYFAFQIRTTDPEHILLLNPESSRQLYARLFSIKSRHLRLSDTDISLLRTAFSLLLANSQEEKACGAQFLTCFLFQLLRTPSIEPSPVRTVGSNIRQALDYIEQNISGTLSVEEIAGVCGYAPSQFNVRFKKETGYTPSKYVALRKIETAKTLLETTDIGVTALACALGFASSNYFASVFKKIMGCSPREYRKQYRDSNRL